MTSSLDALTVLTVLSIVGSAAVTGTLLGFSMFVMHGLARLDDADGARAMQMINLSAPRVPFGIPLAGTTLTSVAVAVLALVADHARPTWLLLVGALAYLLGPVAITGARNVPLNDRLAAMDADGPATGRFWREVYLPRWTAWNTVRSVVGLLGIAAFVVALL